MIALKILDKETVVTGEGKRLIPEMLFIKIYCVCYLCNCVNIILDTEPYLF